MDETALTYFTPRAQQALANAWKEADWFYHDFVGTEHLLLGLLELGQGLAFRILMNSGLTSEGVRLEVARLVGKSAAEVSAGNIPYTPNATQALQLAIEEARTPNHEYVGTEHVLLGLLRVEPSTSSKLFEHCGMDVGKTADEVRLQVRVKISALRDEDELRDRNDFTHHDFSPRAW